MMYVDTGRAGHRLRACTDAIVEFTPEPTGEMEINNLCVHPAEIRRTEVVTAKVVCSASPALSGNQSAVSVIDTELGWYHGNNTLSSLCEDAGRFLIFSHNIT